jgi:hypothetical protein
MKNGRPNLQDIAYAITQLTQSELETMAKGIAAKAQEQERNRLPKKRKPGRPRVAATSAEALIAEIRNIQTNKKCSQAQAFRHYAKIKDIKFKSVDRAYSRAKKTMTKAPPKLTAQSLGEAIQQFAKKYFP